MFYRHWASATAPLRHSFIRFYEFFSRRANATRPYSVAALALQLFAR